MSKLSTTRSTGTKPRVAFANEHAAFSNIEVKLFTLEQLISRASGVEGLTAIDSEIDDRLLGHLPRSARQFNAWESSTLVQHGFPLQSTFRSNAQVTLKRSGQLDRLSTALDALNKIIETPLGHICRQDSLASVRRRLILSNKLRAIAERELLVSKRLIISLQSRIESFSRKLEASNREAASERESRTARIKELEKQVRAQSKSRVIPFQRKAKDVKA